MILMKELQRLLTPVSQKAVWTELEEEDDEQSGLQISENHCSCIFYKCIEAVTEHVVCLKRLKISAYGSSEPLLLLRLMGMSVPSLHIESTGSMIYICVTLHRQINSAAKHFISTYSPLLCGCYVYSSGLYCIRTIVKHEVLNHKI